MCGELPALGLMGQEAGRSPSPCQDHMHTLFSSLEMSPVSPNERARKPSPLVGGGEGQPWVGAAGWQGWGALRTEAPPENAKASPRAVWEGERVQRADGTVELTELLDSLHLLPPPPRRERGGRGLQARPGVFLVRSSELRSGSRAAALGGGGCGLTGAPGPRNGHHSLWPDERPAVRALARVAFQAQTPGR